MPCCCDLRGLAVAVFGIFSAINILFLVGFVVLVAEPARHVDTILEYVAAHGEQLRDAVLGNTVRELLVRNTTEHFALPITIALVLLLANIFALWGTLFSNHILVKIIELQMKVHEDFTITEKAAARAFSWLKVPTRVFTSKTL